MSIDSKDSDSSIRTNAFVDSSFQRYGFIVDEQNLRKLRDIVAKRILETDKSAILRYHIAREDNYSFTTMNIEDVIAEQNESPRAITSLSIGAQSKDKILTFLLRFSKELGISLEIEGAKRDDVFLLYSDIDEFCKANIFKKRLRPQTSEALRTGSILFSILIAFFPVFVILGRERPSQKEIASILESKIADDKLNFIVKHGVIDSNLLGENRITFLIAFAGIILSIIFARGFFGWMWRKLYPLNIFILGKMKEKYQKSLQLRSNSFWTVIIGTIVSLVSGLIIWSLD